MNIKKIKPEEAKKLIDNNNCVIIDAREKREYENQHIKSSINIPIEEINYTSLLPKDKNQNILVYCNKGIKSRNFCYIANEMGYNNIFDLGSIYDWPFEKEGKI